MTRAIILVFDSMRYDIWRQLVKPMLEREYVIEEDVGFALLPSETRVSRRSFFAGKPPSATPKSGKESDLFAELVSSFHGKRVIMEDTPRGNFGGLSTQQMNFPTVFKDIAGSRG